MQDPQTSIATDAQNLSAGAQQLADQANQLALNVSSFNFASGGQSDFFTMGLTIFVLACFVGYYVVWRVTPALHSPPHGDYQRYFFGDYCWRTDCSRTERHNIFQHHGFYRRCARLYQYLWRLYRDPPYVGYV
jgi:hypothetical protein